MNFDQISMTTTMMKKMTKKSKVVVDDHDENVVVKTRVLANELWPVMIFFYYDCSTLDVMISRMKMTKKTMRMLTKIDDEDDEVLEIDWKKLSSILDLSKKE